MAKEQKTITETAIIKEYKLEDLTSVAPELAESGAVLVDELAGVWEKRDGETIVGQITHAYSWYSEENERWVHGVALETRAPTRIRNDESGSHIVGKGAIVGITIGAKLDALRYLRPGDVVAVTFLSEVDLKKGGRRVHRYKVMSAVKPRETMMPDGSPNEA